MRTISNLRELAYTDAKIQEIRTIARKLHKQDENACNHGLTPRQEKIVDRLEKQAEELAQSLGLHAYHQGDPRGCTIYLVESLDKDYQYTDGIAIC